MCIRDSIKKIEKIASKFGVGRDTHVGDTIIGIKGRVGFEAAAPILIIKAHHLLEKHTLTKWQLIYKEQLCINYGLLLHEGQYLDPVMRDIEEFLTSSQKNVSGDVFIKLNPYRYELIGIKSKFDLKCILGSDVDIKICSKFGVWVEKSMYGKKYMGIQRSTFLINTEQRIQHIWNKVKVPGHAEEVLEIVKKL